jgi:hypothetical protein
MNLFFYLNYEVYQSFDISADEYDKNNNIVLNKSGKEITDENTSEEKLESWFEFFPRVDLELCELFVVECDEDILTLLNLQKREYSFDFLNVIINLLRCLSKTYDFLRFLTKIDSISNQIKVAQQLNIITTEFISENAAWAIHCISIFFSFLF